MSNFVDDLTDLPEGKVDARPRGSRPANTVVMAAEWQTVMQALKDLRGKALEPAFTPTPRFTPSDANDVIVWKFDEAAGSTTFVNSATGATAGNLVAAAGNLVKAGVAGIFGPAPALGRTQTAGKVKTADGTPVSVGTSGTIHGWCRFDSSLVYDQYVGIVEKSYRADGASYDSPFVVAGIGFFMPSNNVKQLRVMLAVGSGTLKEVVANAGDWDSFQPGWNHFGMTWDGSNIKAYLNGNLSKSIAQGGAIDLNGNVGQWYSGCFADGTGTFLNGRVQHVRVSNTARSAAYFEQVYRYGVYGPY